MTAPGAGEAGSSRSWVRLGIALFLAAFGIASIVSGGRVIFGPASARAAAGHYLPFVVGFNFLAGFAYVAAAAGIALGRRWGAALAVAIAAGTALVLLGLGIHALRGGAYEPRTAAAMVFRTGVWAAVAFWSARRLR